jgi:hypothetical protein
MKRHSIFLVSMTSLLCAAEPLVVSKDSAMTFYREFKRLTAEPRFIAPLTAELCRTPSKEQLDEERAITGPHTRVAVHIYANPLAVASIADKAAEFPVGQSL